MSDLPDYDLDDLQIITTPQEIKAAFHDLRETICDLLLERAATVGELAEAVDRPKSTVAYHVGVLVDAGLLKVVRTRRVRAIEERFYGRTARIFYVGQIQPEQLRDIPNLLKHAAAESGPAHAADRLRAIQRHARIPRERAAEFWDRVFDLTREFSAIPRDGDTVYGFVAGLYPTSGRPSLPDIDDPPADHPPADHPQAGRPQAGGS
ncbi:ArsR/SmtB family transcription factor [Euzebya sp.]|uniref:ArsR/SmtB family transcription factor n=1 Tax=Euzebya sp. TaxID=1971409 RepID=UPI0035131055